jgi:hypothetical protein
VHSRLARCASAVRLARGMSAPSLLNVGSMFSIHGPGCSVLLLCVQDLESISDSVGGQPLAQELCGEFSLPLLSRSACRGSPLDRLQRAGSRCPLEGLGSRVPTRDPGLATRRGGPSCPLSVTRSRRASLTVTQTLLHIHVVLTHKAM